MKSWEPQPYATMSIDQYLFDSFTTVNLESFLQRYKRDLITAIAFDRERGYLYVTERQADEEKSIIHVFQITDIEPAGRCSISDISVLGTNTVNSPMTITATASDTSNRTVYYRFGIIEDYGTGNYDSSTWTPISEYTTNNSISYTSCPSGQEV